MGSRSYIAGMWNFASYREQHVLKGKNKIHKVVSFFKSPRRSYERAKFQTKLHDFDGDIFRRIVNDFYDRSM